MPAPEGNSDFSFPTVSFQRKQTLSVLFRYFQREQTLSVLLYIVFKKIHTTQAETSLYQKELFSSSSNAIYCIFFLLTTFFVLFQRNFRKEVDLDKSWESQEFSSMFHLPYNRKVTYYCRATSIMNC